jgi:hypothetical protein
VKGQVCLTISEKLISPSQARKDFIQEQAQSVHTKEKISQKESKFPSRTTRKEASKAVVFY